MPVTVDVSGALTLLQQALADTQDLGPVFESVISPDIDEMFRKQFETEGAYGGPRWTPLAPVTKLLRQGRGRGRGGIGRDTNRLWASLTKGGTPPDGLKIVEKQKLTRGTTVPYARFFNDGTKSTTFVVISKTGQKIPLRRKTPKLTPARPLVPNPVPDPVVQGWTAAITKFITVQNAK